jgi:hypothetical protein
MATVLAFPLTAGFVMQWRGQIPADARVDDSVRFVGMHS